MNDCHKESCNGPHSALLAPWLARLASWEPKLPSSYHPQVMTTILFNAFSFLQKKLKARDLPCINAPLDVAEGTTVEDLLAQMDLSPGDVEAVFVNGRVRPVDTVLTDGDRVALVPPGSPGPYRLLLGMVGKNKN